MDTHVALEQELGAEAQLIEQVRDIFDRSLALEAEFRDELAAIHPAYAASARNLVHYLALRRHDRRPLQEQLSAHGLSSLGRSEANVLPTLTAVLRALHRLAGREGGPPLGPSVPGSVMPGGALLYAHTEALLGAAPAGRSVRIMVTLPSEAAVDGGLVQGLLARGTDLVRINCAHDGPEPWAGMIRHVRAAEAALGRRCGVLMDLAGPKLRTGLLPPGPEVVRWRVQRDAFGRVTAPARLWLTPAEAPVPAPPGASAVLPVAGAWLAQRRPGEVLTLRDLRAKKRRLIVTAIEGASRWAEADSGAYVGPGTVLQVAGHRQRGGHRSGSRGGQVGALPGQQQALLLHVGETLVLTRAQAAGSPALRGPDGAVVRPARIACTLPDIFADVRLGQRISFDDGKIGGVITQVSADALEVRITQASYRGSKLRADKGINLPESTLRIPQLTEEDLANLDFMAQHADLVGLSFAQDVEGVHQLQAALAERCERPPGILLKIETQHGFEQLPRLLLAAMRSAPVGVMIARGDLAVECGYERLAEVQEEILWLCEAAHIPVVWATQVLENLAQTGTPSRAEITDAAMGERAECVMLNKGPHILAAVTALDDILRRMQEHQHKKSAMLRRLHVSEPGCPQPVSAPVSATAGPEEGAAVHVRRNGAEE